MLSESIPTGMIRLHAPANFTIGYIGSQNIYVYWYEPMNYHLHLPLDIARLANNIGKTNINVTAVNDSVPNTDEVGYNVVTTLPEHDTSTKPGKTIKPMDWIGHSLVPYHLGQLNSYFLIWRKNGTGIGISLVIIIFSFWHQCLYNMYMYFLKAVPILLTCKSEFLRPCKINNKTVSD